MKIERKDDGVVVTQHERGDVKDRGGWNGMRMLAPSDVPEGQMRQWAYVATIDMVFETGTRADHALRIIYGRLGMDLDEQDVDPIVRSVKGQLYRMRAFATKEPEKFRRQMGLRVTRLWIPRGETNDSSTREMTMTMKVNGSAQNITGGAFGKESRAADLLWKMKLQGDKFDEMLEVARAETGRLDGAEDKIAKEHEQRTESAVRHFEAGKARLEEQIRQLEEDHTGTLRKIDDDRDGALETVSERQTLWAKRLAVVEGLADIS